MGQRRLGHPQIPAVRKSLDNRFDLILVKLIEPAPLIDQVKGIQIGQLQALIQRQFWAVSSSLKKQKLGYRQSSLCGCSELTSAIGYTKLQAWQSNN